MPVQNLRLKAMLFSSLALLLLPLLAMQFSNEVNWSLFDFVVAGILLFGTSLIIELVFRTVRRRELRIILALLILAALLIVWVELAVGVFGTPFAGS